MPAAANDVAARAVAAVDFWIQFSERVSRRPAPWLVLHRLLSVPLLVRMERRVARRSAGGERVSVRVRSDHVGSLLGALEPAPGGGADVEVVQVHPWAAWWWRRRGRLTVPAFVRFSGPVASVPPARISKSLRGSLSRARREGLAVRRGGGADWDRARALAESWARSRFGAEAWFPPRHSWRRLRRHGDLLLIGDVAVAVVVPARGGREAWFASIGLAAAGAGTAAYDAAVAHARAIGAETFDVGRCSARADDPIAAYKARWGLRPAADPTSPVYALRARTAAGERLLAATPLWALGRAGTLRLTGRRGA